MSRQITSHHVTSYHLQLASPRKLAVELDTSVQVGIRDVIDVVVDVAVYLFRVHESRAKTGREEKEHSSRWMRGTLE